MHSLSILDLSKDQNIVETVRDCGGVKVRYIRSTTISSAQRAGIERAIGYARQISSTLLPIITKLTANMFTCSGKEWEMMGTEGHKNYIRIGRTNFNQYVITETLNHLQ